MVDVNDIKTGDQIFLIKKAFQEANTDPTFEDCLDVVIQVVIEGQVPALSGFTTRNNGYQYANLVIHAGLISEDDRQQVLKITKLAGIASIYDPGLIEMPTSLTIEETKNGKGKLVSTLKRIGVYEVGMEYLKDEISLSEFEVRVKEIRKIFEKQSRLVWSARIGTELTTEQSGTEQKPVKLNLPLLNTLAEWREFCTKIVEAVKKPVIGQDEAVKNLVIRFSKYIKNPDDSDPLIITGPTGCGKTHSLRIIAHEVGIPFGRIVVPELTPAGYVGINLQDAIASTLLGVYEKVSGKPERMILQFDEFNKLVGDEKLGQLKQQELLGLLEKGATLKRKNIMSFLVAHLRTCHLMPCLCFQEHFLL